MPTRSAHRSRNSPLPSEYAPLLSSHPDEAVQGQRPAGARRRDRRLAAPDTELHLTVDEPDDHWTGHIGLITALLEEVDPAPKNTIAITCGPPIMIYYANQTLHKPSFAPEACYVTLEARMHCGIGKCGRCNLGEKLICVDGPVFSMAEVGHLLESFV
jgi:NAD(P)H-flavin reductase